MVSRIGHYVQEFYNKTPFPDYELARFNSREDLRLAAYPFAQILDRSIPANASILDVGTGTGQLAAFLSLRRKRVWGIDFSDGSLTKAKALKERLGLDSLRLKKVDILDVQQIKEMNASFDYVLCLGVLHHTGNAYAGFQNILQLLNPGGFLAIGLYHALGRIPLHVRRFLAKTVFQNNAEVKDWFIRMQIGDVGDRERVRGWWNDQYLHPHETMHTLGEVLKWFAANNVEFQQTIPSSTLFDETRTDIAGVWNPTNQTYPHTPLRQLVQLTWLWKTHREGGYWVTFGRKRDDA